MAQLSSQLMEKVPLDKTIAEVFEYCPTCGLKAAPVGESPFRCTKCDYIHFFGPCTAVAGVFCDPEGRVLFLKRQRDPCKGKLGLPGGFLDAGETLEGALRREADEEMNLKIRSMEYLASFPNTYVYRGVALPVTDTFFHCSVDSFDSISPQKSEVAGWQFRHPDEFVLDEMAFESNRKAVEVYLQKRQ